MTSCVAPPNPLPCPSSACKGPPPHRPDPTPRHDPTHVSLLASKYTTSAYPACLASSWVTSTCTSMGWGGMGWVKGGAHSPLDEWPIPRGAAGLNPWVLRGAKGCAHTMPHIQHAGQAAAGAEQAAALTGEKLPAALVPPIRAGSSRASSSRGGAGHSPHRGVVASCLGAAHATGRCAVEALLHNEVDGRELAPLMCEFYCVSRVGVTIMIGSFSL